MSVLRRALVAGFLLALARAALHLLVGGAWDDQALFARPAAREILVGGLLAVPLCSLFAWWAGRLRSQGRASSLLAALPAVALAWALVVGVLPWPDWSTPGTDRRGLVAHGVAVGLAAAVSWGLFRRRSRQEQPGPWAAAVAGGTFLLAAAVQLSGSHAHFPERPNLILVSLDTLRADRLGSYGYARDTSPHLDRFAERAVRFENAFTHQPWTLVAHMSMLTGQHPSVHGVDTQVPLPAGVPTLAAVLRDAGYRNLGVVDGCTWLAPRYGFDRGFHSYVQLDGQADTKARRALGQLDDVAEPFFLFAHFFDAHSDRDQLAYDAELEDRERFEATALFDGCDEELGCATRYLKQVMAQGKTPSSERLEAISNQYDAGVRSLDRRLGVFFDALEKRGLFERSVVVVTSDHGEELFEHGMFLHRQPYDEVMRVPLFVRTPETTGTESAALAGSVDLVPTLLELAGVEAPATQGRSLVPFIRGEPDEASRAVFFETGEGPIGLRTARWSAFESEGAWSLYDLEADPLQRTNLAGDAEHAPILAELRARLSAERERFATIRSHWHQGPGDVALSAAERKELSDLGYLDDE